MNSVRPPNEGERPSLLLLGRYAAGELDVETHERLRATLDDHSRQQLAEIEAAVAMMPPLDLRALRRRAASLPSDLPAPVPANNTRNFRGRIYGWAPLFAMAAAILFAALVFLQPIDEPDIRVRSGETLQIYHLASSGGLPYKAGTALGENDMLAFSVSAAGHSGVVVLSVDGNGTVSVFYPQSGDVPEPIEGAGLVNLPGSVILDGAPGPEIFLAVFDRSVAEAKKQVEHTYQSGGPTALVEWAKTASDVDAVTVTRR